MTAGSTAGVRLCTTWSTLGIALGTAACAGISASPGGGPEAPPAPPATGTAAPAATDAERFLRAIEDAAVPEPDEVRDLLALSDDNAALVWRDPAARRQVLVASWMAAETAQQFYSPAGKQARVPADRPRLWVSLAPEARGKCRAWGLGGDALRVRMAQMIGVSPDVAYDTYVQLWVDRAALFRPCPDPDPTDARCELSYDRDNPPQVPGIADYHAFWVDLYERSYHAGGAPWNRLGYTLDWSGGDEYGVSELMLVPGAAYEVESIATLDAYCAPG